MTEESPPRTAFVLGKPIKNPADFYGRQDLLGRLYEHILAMQPVSVVGEHRCGNTSVLYQLRHPDVAQRYLAQAEIDRLVFAFVSGQLASDSPEALFRRIGIAIRRADAAADVDLAGARNHVWLESYLEQLDERGKRLVLLLDEVELLAGFEEEFWKWFEVLVAEYDLSVVASSRADLSLYRSRNGGPAFFSLFRSEYLGSFKPQTVEEFLREKSDITEFDFMAVADTLYELAGRFPFYVQLAAAIVYLHAGTDGLSADQEVEVQKDFAMRTASLFADAWGKLPEEEREVLTRMARDPAAEAASTVGEREALESLERRGYVIDGHTFSSVFAEFVRNQ